MRSRSSSEKGNIFFTLFGAVAVVGILGTAIMATMRGPLTTMVEVNRREQAKTEMNLASRLITIESAAQALSGDCDGDGFVEPLEWSDPGAADAPTNGGFLPATITTQRQDPWGTNYGYCSWDAGVTTGDVACGAAALRLDGDGTGGQSYPIIVMISAGPDQTFGTTCNDNGGGVTRTGDDIVTEIDYQGATAQAGGLWSLSTITPNTAEIAKDLNVTGGASFSGTLNLATASALLPNDATLINCNAANEGLLRIFDDSNPDVLQICDDTNGDGIVSGYAWESVSAGANLWTQLSATSLRFGTDADTNTVGINTTTPDDALDVRGNIGVTGNIELGNDLLFDNNSDFIQWNSGATITGTATTISGAASSSISLDVNGGFVEANFTDGSVQLNGDILTMGTTSNSSASALNVRNNGLTSILFVRNDGNVGINNITPAAALDVTGNANVSGNYRIDGIGVLASTAAVSSTILVGASAGDSVTGADNTIVGGDAAATLTTGTDNIIIGEGADVPAAGTSNYLNIGKAIHADLSSKEVGIGFADTYDVSLFNDTLEVNGDIDAVGTITAPTVTATTVNGTTFNGTTYNITGVTNPLSGVPDCDASTEKLAWTAGTGWSCGTDLQGGGSGGVPLLGELTDVSVAGPSDGQCLVYDATGAADAKWIAVSCGSSGTGVFVVESSVVLPNSSVVTISTDDFLFGSTQLTDSGDTNEDARMFFDKDIAAFRAGKVIGTQWDTRGDQSAAFGLNTIATGEGAMVWGSNRLNVNTGSIEATGPGATAFGFMSFISDGKIESTGTGTTAFGTAINAHSIRATDSGALARGYASGGNIVAGNAGGASGSTAWGLTTGGDITASGNGSTAWGYGGVTSSGTGTTAFGQNVTAGTGANAIAFGFDAQATGTRSLAIGLGDASTATFPRVSGTGSMGIFMGDQQGVNITASSTMAILGGSVVINSDSASTGAQALNLDVEGNVGAALYCDEDGNNCFSAAGLTGGVEGVFIVENNVVLPNSNVVDTTMDDFVFGSLQLTDTGTGAGDKRFFFDKLQGAFRAGEAQSTEWDAPGVNSTAFGLDNTASGAQAMAWGNTASAQADNSTAFGNTVLTTVGAGSIAFGNEVAVSGARSLGIGIGDAAGTIPLVTGSDSMGIFLGDTAGANVTASEVLAIVGGSVIINPSSADATPSTGGATADLELDVEGDIGAQNYCDNDGDVCFTAADVSGLNSAVFEVNANVVRPISGGVVDNSAADFVFGSTQLTNSGDADEAARFFFDKDIAAFRAGSASGTQWDSPGTGSAAFGGNTQATGNYSMAWGDATTDDIVASNIGSTAWGQASGGAITASNTGATAFGFSDSAITASGTGSLAFGYGDLGTIIASGDGSLAWGDNVTASGNFSAALGVGVTAGAGNNSFAIGYETIASGTRSMAFSVGDSTATFPTISASDSIGFFMGNQANIDVNTSQVMAILGGSMIINPDSSSASPAVPDTDLALHVEGNVGANNYCDTAGENCFDPADISTGDTGVFIAENNVVIANSSLVTTSSDDFVFGSLQLTDSTVANDDKRFYFNKNSAAFRAGQATDGQWDAPGTASAAFGYNTTASNNGSMAWGYNNPVLSGEIQATQAGATAWGTTGGFNANIQATGIGSTAWGYANNDTIEATATGATAAGLDASATGSGSFAYGLDVTAGTGNYSFAFGREVIASGVYSAAFGMGDAATVNFPEVTGASSFGIFMGNQDAVEVNRDYVMALLGGSMIINPDSSVASPAVPDLDLALHVEGNVGATEYCDTAGENCFASADVGSGGAFTLESGGVVAPNSSVVDTTSNDFVFGSLQLTDSGTAADDKRMLFDKDIAAFRAGEATGTQWNTMGTGSVGFGRDVITTGNYAAAWGDAGNPNGGTSSITSSGIGSTAFGYSTNAAFFAPEISAITASGNGSMAFGQASGSLANTAQILASNTGAFAHGSASAVSGGSITASNEGATAWGSTAAATGITASGVGSTAFGSPSGGNIVASGTGSTAFGASPTASGLGSVAFGRQVTAGAGAYAIAMGNEVDATGTNSIGIAASDGAADNTVSGQRTVGIFAGTTSGNTVSQNDAIVFMTSGSVGINQVAPNQGALEVKGGSVCVDTNNDNNASSCITAESDIRLKKNIKPIENALDKIEKLRGVEFDWRWDEYSIVDRYEYTPHAIGVIAQEVEKVFPEAMGEENQGFKTVEYRYLVAPLIEGVKELNAKNKALETEVTALKAENAKIQNAVTTLQDQIDLLNKTAISGANKASGENWLLILLLGFAGMGLGAFVLRKKSL